MKTLHLAVIIGLVLFAIIIGVMLIKFTFIQHLQSNQTGLVLSPSSENEIQTVTLNSSSGIPDPCETFRMPCPLHPPSYNFTAQKYGSNIYIEKFTMNGVDNYAMIKPNMTCYYPPRHSNSCTNPDDLAILRLVGVDTLIPQEDLIISLRGLKPSYTIGEPVNFGINIKGFGHCDVPHILIVSDGYIMRESKTSWTSCASGMHVIDNNYSLQDLGGPFLLNQTGSYMIHVDYSSNMTEQWFKGITQKGSNAILLTTPNGAYAGYSTEFNITDHNKLLGAILDNKTETIHFLTSAMEDGNLTVTLVPELVNLFEHGKNEKLPIVLEDGQEIKYTEQLYNQSLILTIPFQSGVKKIEIVGTESI